MTYSSDEVRDRFHRLPTQDQLVLVQFERSLVSLGNFLHVEDVGPESQVLIRVHKEPVLHLPDSSNL